LNSDKGYYVYASALMPCNNIRANSVNLQTKMRVKAEYRQNNYHIQFFDNGCTSGISAAFTRTFSVVIKTLKTIHYGSKANCPFLQVKPLILKHK